VYCSVPECRCVLYAKGLCHTHYQRQKTGVAITGRIRKRTSENEVDIFPKCRCGLRLYTPAEREQKSCNDCLPDNLADFMRTRMRAEGY
jgi:hypothetical protein